MKNLFFSLVLISCNVFSLEQKSTRVTLLNHSIDSTKIKAFNGSLSIIIDNQSFSNVRFELRKNNETKQTVHVKSNSPKTLTLNIKSDDKVALRPISPSFENIELIE